MRGIDPRPSGKFRVRFMHRGRRKSREFDTLDEAEEFRDAVYREVTDATRPIVRGMSLIQAGPSFLARRKQLRNYATDVSRWRTLVATAAFADRALTSVTRREVLDWAEELETKQTSGRGVRKLLSRQSRKHAINLLRRFFDYCIDREVVDQNPVRGVRVGGEPEPIPDDWYLTPDEQGRIAEFDHVERWIALFAIGSGLRQGEQWNLRLVDVHVDGDRPHVLVRFGSEGRTPKNRRTRVVPLFGLALEAARAWLDALPAYAKRNPHGLMFPTPRGARRGKSRVPKQWKAMVAHVGRHVHWHLLRHTAASSLVAGWWGFRWSLEEVKGFMGHSSITVTERYAHLADSRLHELAARTERARDQSQNPGPESTPIPAESGSVLRSSKPGVAGSNPAGRASTYVDPRDQPGTKWSERLAEAFREQSSAWFRGPLHNASVVS